MIRRKAPSSKKTQQQQQQQQQQARQQQTEPAAEQSATVHQVQSLTKSLYELQNKVTELTEINKQLASEIVKLQKSANVQRQANYEMLYYLENSARRATQNTSQPSAGAMARGQCEDGVSPELRRMKELLATLGPPNPPNPPVETSMERSHTMYPSPAESSTSSAMFVAPDLNAGMGVMSDPVTISRLGVYPTARPASMDAFHSDHMQNIAYPVAQNGTLEGVATGMRDTARVTTSPPTEKSDDWGPKKPHIFLVEDDKVCAKIGMKFLKSLGCTVALAVCLIGVLSLDSASLEIDGLLTHPHRKMVWMR